MKQTDVLVIGSGVAGLSFAVNLAKNNANLKITIVTKSSAEETNTRYAQGGIAAVMNLESDNFEQHITDTINAGGGLCDPAVVEMVVRQAPDRIREIIEMGANFDTNSSGKYDLGLEGGHSRNRILHHKDCTGKELESVLLKAVSHYTNITIATHYTIIDLIVEKRETSTVCVGAYYLNLKSKHIDAIQSKVTMICSGGSGQIFKNTTNPEIATGDGVAIANRVGATIKELNYYQFHPTALYEPKRNPSFLISEAVRGYGAYIVNHQEERFVFEYDSRGELATRDIVSHAIGSELIKSGRANVFLDCRHLDENQFLKHFPSITNYCKTIGLDPAKDLLPIVPAAHYQCGGITVDKDGKTSIENLYANGECARTGLHGKNRLASNSLLEALVYAKQAANDVAAKIASIDYLPTLANSYYHYDEVDAAVINSLKTQLQNIMNTFYWNQDLYKQNTIDELKKLHDQFVRDFTMHAVSTPVIEYKNMLLVAQLMLKQAV